MAPSSWKQWASASLYPPQGPAQAGMGFLVHCEPRGQVPSLVLLAWKLTRGPPSPYCTHCRSPWNLSVKISATKIALLSNISLTIHDWTYKLSLNTLLYTLH